MELHWILDTPDAFTYKFMSKHKKVVIPCTVKGFLDDTYGKVPKENADRQVFMEFN